jgi:peroxiredoxin
MQVKASVFLLLLIVTPLACIGPVFGQEEAPPFTLVDINGKEFSLSDYRGKVVLIAFFRIKPSCPACIAEIPHPNAVYNKYSQNDFVIMSISVSSLDTAETLSSDFVQSYDIPWIVACGGTQMASKYSVSGVPTLAIVDANGKLRYRHVGVTEKSRLISEIDSFFIAVISPKNKKYAATSVPLNFTISKAASWIRYSLDGAKNVTISGNTNLTDLADGTHSIAVYFKEDPGNTIYSNKVDFIIDTMPESWMSFELIVIIGVAVVFSLIIGIAVAGQALEWSKPAKKRGKAKN